MFKKISEKIALEIKEQINSEKFKNVIKSIDDNNDDRKFKVVASTGCVDRGNEIVDPHGIDKKHYMKNPVVLWAHSHSTLPIGKATRVYVKDEKIIIEGKFAPEEANPEAEKIYQLYKQGFLNAVSIGFMPKSWEDFKDKEGYKRKYTKWELYELSFVPVPANPEALDIMKAIGKKYKIDIKKMFIIKDTKTNSESAIKDLTLVVKEVIKEVEKLKYKKDQEPTSKTEKKVEEKKADGGKKIILSEEFAKKLRKNVQVADKALEQVNISFKEIIK